MGAYMVIYGVQTLCFMVISFQAWCFHFKVRYLFYKWCVANVRTTCILIRSEYWLEQSGLGWSDTFYTSGLNTSHFGKKQVKPLTKKRNILIHSYAKYTSISNTAQVCMEATLYLKDQFVHTEAVDWIAVGIFCQTLPGLREWGHPSHC